MAKKDFTKDLKNIDPLAKIGNGNPNDVWLDEKYAIPKREKSKSGLPNASNVIIDNFYVELLDALNMPQFFENAEYLIMKIDELVSEKGASRVAEAINLVPFNFKWLYDTEDNSMYIKSLMDYLSDEELINMDDIYKFFEGK